MTTEFGNYRLEEQIGEGTVGQVYRAVDTRTGEDVALKLIRRTYSNDQNVQQRFVREATVLQKLDHPNIVRYIECDLHDGTLYFTMEFIDSGSLKPHLGHPLPWQDVVDLAKQVCRGIQHAHDLGVVHRDLKPANLYLSQAGKVKVGDFGIALDIDQNRLTMEGLTVGTSRYMPPEQITAEEITAEADIYALGCILFEMLTGRVPYVGNTDFEIIEQHLHAVIPEVIHFNPLCPAELSSLVERMLAKQVSDRIGSAQQVLEELEALQVEPAAQPSSAGNQPTAASLEPANLTTRLQAQAVTAPKEVSWSTMAFLFALFAGVVVVFWSLSGG